MLTVNHHLTRSVKLGSRWPIRPDGRYERKLCAGIFNGTFERSVRHVLEFIKREEPIDGLLTFSQGAAFAHALLTQPNVPKLFVIFCCGFIARNASPNTTDDPIVGIPTFHIINSNDQVIPNEESEQLGTVFQDPMAVIKRYECGHCVPPANFCKDDLVEFLKKVQIN